MPAWNNLTLPSAPRTSDYATPLLNFGPLANLGNSFFKGVANRNAYDAQNILRQGLPRNSDGSIDWNSAVALMAQSGSLPAVNTLGTLGINQERAQLAQQTAQGVYGTPIYGTDPATGQTVLGVIDKQGNFRRVDTGGVTPTPGVKMIDTGTGTIAVDTRTGQPIGAPIRKDIAGAETEKKVGQAKGTLIAGEAQNAMNLRNLEDQWKLVDDSITKALTDIDWKTSGLVGSITSRIPGSPAYDLSNVLDTIKANIGFDKLQAMRAASPTGGALGQVSDFENRLLQSVHGALQQGQSPEQLRAHLQRVKRDLEALQQDRRNAFKATYGKEPGQVSLPESKYAPRAGAAESDNRYVKNPNSSASGPYQFTDSSWIEAFDNAFPNIAGRLSRAQKLKMRDNPAFRSLQDKVFTNFTAGNEGVLRHNGIPISNQSKYAAHVFGAAGATRILTAAPTTPIENVVSPQVIKANPFLRGMTVADVRDWLDRKMAPPPSGAILQPGQSTRVGNITIRRVN